MPARDAQIRVLADPLREVGLRLHRAGPNRPRGLKRKVVLTARPRIRQHARENDEVDQIHQFFHHFDIEVLLCYNGTPPIASFQGISSALAAIRLPHAQLMHRNCGEPLRFAGH